MTAEVLSLPRGGATGPAPLVPAGADVRDAPDFRFNIARMLDSDWYHSCSTREALAGINLHARAIHQVPAGSLPGADGLLARLADFGRDVDGWREVKAKALEGWVLCSDGRWYHPDVARNALHIWIGRLEKRRASAIANLAQAPDRDFGLEEISAAFDEACGALRAIDPQDGMLREAIAKATRAKAKRKGPTLVPDAVSADPVDPSRGPTRDPSRGPLDGTPKRSEAKPSEFIPLSQSESGAREDEATRIDVGKEGETRAQLELVGGESSRDTHGFPTNAFNLWYSAYPEQVGRKAARTAFARVQAGGKVRFEELVDGLARYIRLKPRDRPWVNPAKWLAEERWADRFAVPAAPLTPMPVGLEPSLTQRAAIRAAERLGLLDEPRPRD